MDVARLRNLHPLNKLSPKGMQALMKGMQIIFMGADDFVFRVGDSVYDTLYVLEGRVEIMDKQGKVVSTIGNDGLHPFPREVPSAQGARAATDIQLLKIDSQLLSSVLSWDQPGGADAQQADDQPDTDWMAHFLSSRGFSRVPPAKLQTVFMKMVTVTAKAGDVIIKQGTPGDNFYVIARGKVVVEREASNLAQPVKLAEYGPGACFGEDALISGATRNATVRMLTNGKLMKLDKADFLTALKAPLTPEVSYAQATDLIAKGATWVDVRMPNEVQNNRMADSVNIPFPILRARLSTLAEGTPYVVVCSDGKNSSTATFLLSKHGLEAYTLRGGISGIPKA